MSAAGNEIIQTPGVNDVYEYNEIHLDSTQRDAGTNDHPFFDLHIPLSAVLGLKLLSAQIPWTVYNVVADGPTQNNVYRTSGTTRFVPPGFYDAPQLLAALKSNEPGCWAFDTTSGKFAFTNPSSTDAVDLDFQDQRNLARQLGYEPGKVYTVPASQSLQAPYVANVASPNAVYLVSDSVGGRISRNIRVNGATSKANTAIAKIPVTVNNGETLFYTDPTPSNCFDMSMDNLTGMDFYLVDPYTSTPLSLNGSPWSVTFQVLTQRDTSVSRMMQGGVKGKGGAVPSGKRQRVK